MPTQVDSEPGGKLSYLGDDLFSQPTGLVIKRSDCQLTGRKVNDDLALWGLKVLKKLSLSLSDDPRPSGKRDSNFAGK